MPHPYFTHAALGISLLPAVFGLNALFRPTAALRSVDFPVPAAGDVQGTKLASSLMRIYGARNLAVSYLLILVWRAGNPRWTGLALLAGGWMAFVDGLVSKDLTGGGEWNHWSFFPIIGGVVGGLFDLF